MENFMNALTFFCFLSCTILAVLLPVMYIEGGLKSPNIIFWWVEILMIIGAFFSGGLYLGLFELRRGKIRGYSEDGV